MATGSRLLWTLLLAAVTCARPPVELKRASCNATNHYDCGMQVGTQMRSMIREYCCESTPGPTPRCYKPLLQLKKWAATEAGASTVAHYMALHNRSLPMLMDEVRGLAAGANVSFYSLFLLNVQSELFLEANLSAATTPSASCKTTGSTGDRAPVPTPTADTAIGKGCSDFHLALGQGADAVQSWGHNEDGFIPGTDFFYLVTSRITLPGAKAADTYFAFTYPGQVRDSATDWSLRQPPIATNWRERPHRTRRAAGSSPAGRGATTARECAFPSTR
jgi:hypothetical protein